MALVREHGYAVDDEESSPGLRCVGVPVFNHRGRVIGAVSVTGTTYGVPIDALPRIIEAVVRTGTVISREMGFPG